MESRSRELQGRAERTLDLVVDTAAALLLSALVVMLLVVLGAIDDLRPLLNAAVLIGLAFGVSHWARDASARRP